MEGNTLKWLCTKSIVVPIDKIIANDYNPNRMPTVEMDLLMQCILKYDFLFPIITFKEDETYRIIDGYHRYEALKRMGIKEAGIIVLDIPYHDAVQLTVLMNRIKGMHQVERMSDLIQKLEDLGVQDNEICKNLGMEAEEYIRLKQQLGIAHAFKDVQYGYSWTDEK